MEKTVKNFLKEYYEWDESEHEPQQPFIHSSISDLEQLITDYLNQQAHIVSGDVERVCQQCGGKNPTWYADNELFNKVNGSPNGIICPSCFEKKADEMGINIIFKSGYAAAPQKGMKWVKASEKTPTRQVAAKRGGKYGILYPWFNDTFWFHTTDFADKEAFDVTVDLDSIEWLDESPSDSEAGDGWVSVEDGLPECYRIDGKKKYINWVLGTNGKSQFVCVYTKGHELEYGDNDPSDAEYDEVEERNGCLYLKPGWYELEETPGGEYDETWAKRSPTHYRLLPPLPAPPIQLR